MFAAPANYSKRSTGAIQAIAGKGRLCFALPWGATGRKLWEIGEAKD